MVTEASIVKVGLEALKAALTQIGKASSKRKQSQLISGAVAELLQLHPDISKAEAMIAAAELTGTEPDAELFRAKEIFSNTKTWHRKADGRYVAHKKRAAKKKAKRKKK